MTFTMDDVASSPDDLRKNFQTISNIAQLIFDDLLTPFYEPQFFFNIYGK